VNQIAHSKNLSKDLLRQAFRTNLDRDDHDQNLLKANTQNLSQRLTQYLANQTGLWAAFEPLGFEPDIRSSITASTHLEWAYPRVEGETLAFYKVQSRNDLVENKWKILEPDPSRATAVPVTELRGLLIPGLAFDENCNRLGRGRGFYDRALSEISNQQQKIGIALERQVSKMPLPADPHDVVMDRVITEARVIERIHP
jgi:5-formyltetrahydrofolate cyclo-ligase